MNEKYRIAIYIRLSKEDDRVSWGKKEESNSIRMQRMLLEKYVKEHFSNYVLQEFCDDGYTGTNFNRPGVQKLLEQVRKCETDCIVVKDFSRFARDYIELGSYLEQVFPFIGVRFISVNDNYDSKDFQGSIAGMDTNFKNLLYDLYSKDLSQKVRSSLGIRKEQGQYVSANPPFGYEKDPDHRHELVIATDEAQVVRKIFALTLDGYTSTQITRMFNETHVKTPLEFKMEKNSIRRKPKGGEFFWYNSTVCQILRNEVYIGNILQKKYEKDFVNGKNHLKPRQEWITTYNHHEPIIDREIFYKVQEGRGKKRNMQYGKTHPLIGKLVCGCCKRNLQYRHGLTPYFTCHNRYFNGKEDCVDKIDARYLEQYVLCKVQETLESNGEFHKLYLAATEAIKKEIGELEKVERKLTSKIQMERQRNFEVYEEYTSGKRDHFQSREMEITTMKEELVAIKGKIHEKQNLYEKSKSEKESLCTRCLVEELSKKLVEQYIDAIIISDWQHIEIIWRKESK